MPESIRRDGGFAKDAHTYYPVVIVGAGESGIAMGCRLKEELGFNQFRIFERQAGIGGTWWINRYPGVACDIPAVFYSFSFAPNLNWSTFFPPGEEIFKYLVGVCEKYEIIDKIQCNTDVETCRWLEDEQEWEVTLRHLAEGMGDISEKHRRKIIRERGESAVVVAREVVRAKIICSAVGGLVEPRGWPEDIPGSSNFKGPIFHSARWDDGVDLKDKDVVVVGTGCSAAQFVPLLTKEPYSARSVTQLMRSPPWVSKRALPPGGDEWWEKWSPTLMANVPGFSRLIRTFVCLAAEYDFRLFGGSKWAEKERKKLEAKLLRHMKRTVPEKYHEILTPDYELACKRRIFDRTWFPALNEERVELTTLPLTGAQEHSVILGPGRCYPDPNKTDSKVSMEQKTVPADVIILANGFEVHKWLHPLKVVGKGGKDLVGTMEERGGPQAYQGTAMDGFPNFFIIFGPNTATGHTSVILATENMVNYSLKFIKLLLDGDATTVDVKKEAEIGYNRDIQAKLKRTVWGSGGCHSWYVREDGWNSTVYPYTQAYFTWRCMFPKWGDWNICYTRQGLFKRYGLRGLKLIAFTAIFLGVYRARQKGFALSDARDLLKRGLGTALSSGVKLLEWSLNKVGPV